MDIKFSITDDEAAALQADIAVDRAIAVDAYLIEMVRQRVIAPLVVRQSESRAAKRLERLRTLSAEDQAAVDAILNKAISGRVNG